MGKNQKQQPPQKNPPSNPPQSQPPHPQGKEPAPAMSSIPQEGQVNNGPTDTDSIQRKIPEECPECHLKRMGLVYKITDISTNKEKEFGVFRCECGCEFTNKNPDVPEVLKHGRFLNKSAAEIRASLPGHCPQSNFHPRGHGEWKLEDISEEYAAMNLKFPVYRCECGCEFEYEDETHWGIHKDGEYQPPPDKKESLASKPSEIAHQGQEERVERDFPRRERENPTNLLIKLMKRQMEITLAMSGHVKTPDIIAWEAEMETLRKMLNGDGSYEDDDD